MDGRAKKPRLSMQRPALASEHQGKEREHVSTLRLDGLGDVPYHLNGLANESVFYGQGIQNAVTGDVNVHGNVYIGFEKADLPATDPLDNGNGIIERRELLDLLYFEHIDERLCTLKKAYDKTCQWFLHKEQYKNWRSAENLHDHHGFLWIKGKPGAGKSILMKFLDSKAKEAAKANLNALVVAFFFNARGDHLEKSTTGLYRSLLWQLFEKAEDLQKVLDNLDSSARRIIRKKGWELEILKETLAKVVENLGCRTLQFFIDALDECDDDDVTDMVSFFEEIGEKAVEVNVRVHICFSSRHYPTISIRWGLEIVLENEEEHGDDIARYVKSKVKLDSSRRADSLRSQILEKSAGVFLWVALVIPMLNAACAQGRVDEFQKCLDEIPRGLDDLFEMILTRDRENMEELRLYVQWILFAMRPLTLEEYFFAIRSPKTPETTRCWISGDLSAEDMGQFVHSSSKGLAEVTRTRSEDKMPVVLFIHESVRDFFLVKDGKRRLWPDFDGPFVAYSHEVLKDRCLAEINGIIGNSTLANLLHTTQALPKASSQIKVDLSKHAPPNESLPEASPKQAPELRQSAEKVFPFLEYAVRNILKHANAAEGGAVSQMNFVQSFQLADWIKLDNLFERHKIRQHRNASLLYILAEHNLANLIRCHPSKLSCFEVEGERYGTPIFAALATDSGEAIRALLKAQVDINPAMSPLRDLCEQYCEDGNKRTDFGRSFTFSRRRGILSHLTEQGDEIITLAFLLASNRLDTNSRDSTGRTPLSWAAGRGHEVVVKLLLGKEANIESTDKGSRTPLSWATEKGHEAVVKLLLEKGADANSKDKGSQTPLLWAASKGNDTIVKLLLEKGADADSKYSDGRTPLSWATAEGHEAVVKLLLEKGADVNSKDGDCRTPLLWAAKEGIYGAVKILLEKGTDANSNDSDGRTPLSWAAEGQEAVVKLLLEKGADANSRDIGSRTPLLWAAAKGNEAIVQLLLEKGADANSKYSDGRTPLSWAAKEGNGATVKLLLEKGANANSKDGDGRTPLLWAAKEGNDAALKLLLEKGADANSKDNDGRTPLLWATRNLHEAVVKLLLAIDGVDADSQDNNGRSALFWAAANIELFEKMNQTRIGQLSAECHPYQMELMLLERRNKVRSVTARPGMPRNSNTAVIKLLLGRVNVELSDKDGRTPLSWAVEEGNDAVIKLLLEKGANAESSDTEGRTPLSLAADQGHEDVIKLLQSYYTPLTLAPPPAPYRLLRQMQPRLSQQQRNRL
ncbi:Ankyrin repeat domain-containing protein 50 [Tolypocladium ophioglossoides CBS 100239]|uniref:Ankyrin repeat domain-containing protein 50 n=1 Tax=Tolypocladium ophioglossoides (strain CBS 100239) TaxID=1163406 RepID=A0A0L0N152_TOLOC|nr:Ankyrin repeat domain-containing protein 50 [Tolypocladium ophioglossoides CBS 100239]